MYSRKVPKLEASVIVSKAVRQRRHRVVREVAEARPEPLRQGLDRGVRESAGIAEDS